MARTTKPGDYQIPFDKETGSLIHYIGSRYPYHKINDRYNWVDNHEFEAELYIKGLKRGGGSASNFVLLDEERKGREYYIFARDLLDVLQNREVDNGAIQRSNWTFIKRGTKFGIRLAR